MATVILEMTLLGHWPYVPIYLIVRPLNFATMCWLVRPTITASLTALILAWVTYLSLPADISLFSAAAILQGGAFILFGISAVKQEPVLAVLWMLCGAFNLAFSHGWNISTWMELNQWWQAALYAMVFALLATVKNETLAYSRQSN